MKRLAISVLIVVASFSVGLAKVASVLEICNKNDEDLSGCLSKVVEKIRPNMASGDYGEGRIAPKLDPMWIERLEADHGPSFRVKLKNITVEGLSKFEIRKIRPDLANKRFIITAKVASCVARGKYDLDMSLLLLKISGKGDFNLTLDNNLVHLKIQYFVEPKDGKNFVKFHPVELKIKFDKAKFYLTNLFGGDPALGQIGNQAINANSRMLLDEMTPALLESLRDTVTTIANKVVEGSEEDELFPEKKS